MRRAIVLATALSSLKAHTYCLDDTNKIISRPRHYEQQIIEQGQEIFTQVFGPNYYKASPSARLHYELALGGLIWEFFQSIEFKELQESAVRMAMQIGVYNFPALRGSQYEYIWAERIFFYMEHRQHGKEAFLDAWESANMAKIRRHHTGMGLGLIVGGQYLLEGSEDVRSDGHRDDWTGPLAQRDHSHDYDYGR